MWSEMRGGRAGGELAVCYEHVHCAGAYIWARLGAHVRRALRRVDSRRGAQETAAGALHALALVGDGVCARAKAYAGTGEGQGPALVEGGDGEPSSSRSDGPCAA